MTRDQFMAEVRRWWSCSTLPDDGLLLLALTVEDGVLVCARVRSTRGGAGRPPSQYPTIITYDRDKGWTCLWRVTLSQTIGGITTSKLITTTVSGAATCSDLWAAVG